jgi:hypothetical protein
MKRGLPEFVESPGDFLTFILSDLNTTYVGSLCSWNVLEAIGSLSDKKF